VEVRIVPDEQPQCEHPERALNRARVTIAGWGFNEARAMKAREGDDATGGIEPETWLQ